MLHKLANLFQKRPPAPPQPKPAPNPHLPFIIEQIGVWADRKGISRSYLGLVDVKTDDSEGFIVTILTTNPQLLMGVSACNVRQLTNHLRGTMQMKLKVQIEAHNLFAK